MTIHDSLEVAFHAHIPLDAPTWTVPVPPSAGKSASSGDTSNRHSAAACVIGDRSPLTTTPPVRVTGSGFAAASKRTVPSPWPLAAPVTLSQFASADAVHWHSRAALTETLPLPPPAGIVDVALPTVRSHRDTVVGAATVLVDDPHAAAARTAHAAAGNKGKRP